MAELDALEFIVGLDHRNILDVDKDARTTTLELIKNQLIRSSVILKYTLMDEFLTNVVCRYFFGPRPFPQLWRTRRFRNFNYFIIEKMYLQQKLDLVKAAHDIPRKVSSDLMQLNDLRNGLVHSFFPENRRLKPEWKGKNVFSIEGIEQFMDDMEKLGEFFMRKFFAGSMESL
jgi:hypothetical protein